MKKIVSIIVMLIVITSLSGCGNFYSYEDIEKIKSQAIEEAKEDILEDNALDYVKENYTPEEAYPEKVILNRGKSQPVQSSIHGALPKNSKPEDGYIIINKKSKIFHRSDCPAVDEMKDTNKITSNKTPKELIDQGYEPCGQESW